MGEGNMSIAPRWAIGRRGMVSGLAAGAALAPAALLPKPAWAGIPGNRKLAFDVFRNGKPIGSHVLTFEQAGDGLTVRVSVDLAVRLLGLVVYRYQTRGTDTWRGNVLMAAPAETNDDYGLSLIHISEPTRLRRISYVVFCSKNTNFHSCILRPSRCST